MDKNKNMQIIRMNLHALHFLQNLEKFHQKCNLINKDLCVNLRKIVNEIQFFIENEPIICTEDNNFEKQKYQKNGIIIQPLEITFYCDHCKKNVKEKHLESHIKGKKHLCNLNKGESENCLKNYKSTHEPIYMTLHSSENKDENGGRDPKNLKINRLEVNDNEREKLDLKKCTNKRQLSSIGFFDTFNKLFEENKIQILTKKFVNCKVCNKLVPEVCKNDHSRGKSHNKILKDKSKLNLPENIYTEVVVESDIEPIFFCHLCETHFLVFKSAYNHINKQSHISRISQSQESTNVENLRLRSIKTDDHDLEDDGNLLQTEDLWKIHKRNI